MPPTQTSRLHVLGTSKNIASGNREDTDHLKSAGTLLSFAVGSENVCGLSVLLAARICPDRDDTHQYAGGISLSIEAGQKTAFTGALKQGTLLF